MDGRLSSYDTSTRYGPSTSNWQAARRENLEGTAKANIGLYKERSLVASLGTPPLPRKKPLSYTAAR